jgi:hypothetical protein
MYSPYGNNVAPLELGILFSVFFYKRYAPPELAENVTRKNPLSVVKRHGSDCVACDLEPPQRNRN